MKTKTTVEFLNGRPAKSLFHASRKEAEAFAVTLSKGGNVHCVTVHTVFINGKKQG